MTAADPHRAIDAIWRIESAKLIAGLARIVSRRRACRGSRAGCEARVPFEVPRGADSAASLTRNARERTLLLERAAAAAAVT